MIVVDTSAIIAIFRREPEAAAFAVKIADAEVPMISVASVLEASIVLRALKHLDPEELERWLDAFLADARMRIEPVTVEQSRIARAAHEAFGKGSGHPVKLNFGDCFTYALAKSSGAPLLFKGDDFSKTDLVPA